MGFGPYGPNLEIGNWFRSKRREPEDIQKLAQNLVWHSSMKDRAIARLIELGRPARDALVAMAQGEFERGGFGPGRRSRTQLVTLYVLGAAGDRRLQDLDMSTVSTEPHLTYLAKVRTRPGIPLPSTYSFAGFLRKRVGCERRRTDPRTGRRPGIVAPGIAPLEAREPLLR
jgi:hypothetical protein